MKTILALAILIAATPAHHNDPQEPKSLRGDDLDDILPKELQGKYGFAKLSPKERTEVAGLLTTAMRVGRKHEATEAIVRDLGYEFVRCARVELKGDEQFVVEDRFGRYATSNIPALAPTTGEYWVKPDRLGGIVELWDAGRKIDFHFATWRRL